MSDTSFVLLLAGCSLIDPHNMIGRQMGEATPLPTEVVPSPKPATMGQAERERAFDFVWRTIENHYYNAALNGVDWNAVGARYRPLALGAKDDEEFWETLDKMTGELKDAHTRVESPKRVELRNREETISLGFTFRPIEGKLAVTAVNRDSDAWWAGVRAGMTLSTIAGEPAMAAYEKLRADTRYDSTERSRHIRALRRLLSGAPGTGVAFTFEREDGTTISATLARRTIPTRPSVTRRILPSGYGYLAFTQWTFPVISRVIDALDQLKSTPGLIIDLRGNPGGAAHAVSMLLERFFPKKTELGQVITRTGKPVSLFLGTVEIIKLKRIVEGDKNAYTKPVVVIVDAGSASASELFAGTMQAVGRATVVGEPSCGCLLGFLGYARIPGGAELAYSEVGFILSNGKRIEGEGVIPDHPVPATLADLRRERDRSLEEAQRLLGAATTKTTSN